MDDLSRAALAELVDRLETPVEFGPTVGEEFRKGYAAGRRDILATVDVAVTALLEDVHKPDVGLRLTPGQPERER